MRPPRFLADADFNQKIVLGIRRREPSVDFLNALDGGVIGLPDPEVIGVAAQSGWILVSHDRKTMASHFARSSDRRSVPLRSESGPPTGISLCASPPLIPPDKRDWLRRSTWPAYRQTAESATSRRNRIRRSASSSSEQAIRLCDRTGLVASSMP